MAKKKTAEDERDRLDLRIDPPFRKRLQRQADRFTGGNISAYLRLAATERLERDEATDPRDDDDD